MLKRRFAKIKLLIKRIRRHIFAHMIPGLPLNRFGSKSEKWRRNSVLTPLNWLVWGMGGLVLWYTQSSNEWWVKAVGLLIVVVLLLFYALNYLWFRKNRPEDLHSEEYLIAKQGIELMASQGEIPKKIEDVSPIEGTKLLTRGRRTPR